MRATIPKSLDAELLLRDTLPHPDLSPVNGGGGRIPVTDHGSPLLVNIAGDIEHDQAADIEEAIWEKLHFASHLRSIGSSHWPQCSFWSSITW